MASWSGNWPVEPRAFPSPEKCVTNVSGCALPPDSQGRPPSVERLSSSTTPCGPAT